MVSSQLGRTLLSGPSLPPDRQEATPDEEGSYGEFTDLIDRVTQADDGRCAKAAEPSLTLPC
jgi:hypothetical protein